MMMTSKMREQEERALEWHGMARFCAGRKTNIYESKTFIAL
jgi:hypothetical protein